MYPVSDVWIVAPRILEVEKATAKEAGEILQRREGSTAARGDLQALFDELADIARIRRSQ